MTTARVGYSLRMDTLTIGDRSLRLEQGDITRIAVDAIVNAANSSLMGGGGVDGAIHRAGGPEILAECRRIVADRGRLPAGHAVITTAGRMPSRHVIHTVGPVWHGGAAGEAATLARAYRECLRVAEAKDLQTVAFPSISTGSYGYPVVQAAEVALGTVASFLRDEARSTREIVFVLYDGRTYAAYAEALASLGPSAD